MQNQRYISKRTSELELGDVVLCHGMRVRIDRPLEISTAHPESPAGDGKTRYTLGLVLNRDEVPAYVVPLGWTSKWDRRRSFDAPAPHDGEHRWTIQGNDLAVWYVEQEEPADEPAPRVDRVRDRVAELELLRRYDVRRQISGHDYGSGQRSSELSRRRRELWELVGIAGGDLDREPTAAELLAAFERVGAPKLARVERETFRHETPTTRRTLRTWRAIEAELRSVEVPR